MTTTDAATVFIAALITALATGLGALPLLSSRVSGRNALGLANAAASGVMLGASLSLVLEGMDRGSGRTALGLLAGVAFILVLSRLLHVPHEELVLGTLRGEDAVRRCSSWR